MLSCLIDFWGFLALNLGGKSVETRFPGWVTNYRKIMMI